MKIQRLKQYNLLLKTIVKKSIKLPKKSTFTQTFELAT